jgi:hypothetical protein
MEENLTVRLDETLYAPDLRSNLLSVTKMTEHGFEVIFRRNEAIVTNPDTGENVIVARRDKHNMYILHRRVVRRKQSVADEVADIYVITRMA